MTQGEEEMQAAKLAGDELEPYRRLIELQRQMIELVRQHEKTKRECSALREQLSREMAVLLRAQPARHQRNRMNAAFLKWVKRTIATLKKRAWKRLRQSVPFLRARMP